MKLVGFRIQNIKSVKDTGICHLSDNDNITVFAGQNEAGKSAILEGLNFFRNGSTDNFERLSKRSDSSKPYVECIFQLQDKDWGEDSETSNILGKFSEVTFSRGDLSKDDYSEIKISPQILESFDVEINKFIQHFDEGKSASEKKQEKPGIDKESPAENVSDATPESVKQDPDPVVIKEKIIKQLIDNLPEFIYYDSFSSILPGTVKFNQISNFPAISDFQNVFSINFAETLKKNAQARTSDIYNAVTKASVDLNEYWKQKQTTKEDDHYQYSINLIPNEEDFDQSTIEFLVHRNDATPLFIEQKSKGFQWFSSFNLRLKALGVDSKAIKKYVILIDEPGQGLHETAQSDVKAVLEELANKGIQILYTTHNPCLIGVADNEILRIRLVFQTRENGTQVKNIAQFSTAEGSIDALSPIITAMGISSVGQFLDRTIPCVALEGITDHYYLTALKKILDIKENYSFIPAVGVSNIRPLISVLLGWGMDFRAVFDDGAGKKLYTDVSKYIYKDDNDSLEKHVHKLDGFEGIEDLFSSADFDNYIIGEKRSDDKLKNSDIAKTKKKELLARLFLEKVNTPKNDINLSKETKQNFNKVFTWLKNSHSTKTS